MFALQSFREFVRLLKLLMSRLLFHSTRSDSLYSPFVCKRQVTSIKHTKKRTCTVMASVRCPSWVSHAQIRSVGSGRRSLLRRTVSICGTRTHNSWFRRARSNLIQNWNKLEIAVKCDIRVCVFAQIDSRDSIKIYKWGLLPDTCRKYTYSNVLKRTFNL